jgi:hypothetical protein
VNDSAATSCRPNFSAAGRVRRQRVGWSLAAVSVVSTGALIALHTPWTVRLLVALPVMAAAVSLLQVSRHTCVAHAALGTFEHDDFSVTKQSEADAAASRRVARSIYRDAALIGLLCAALAAGTAFVF